MYVEILQYTMIRSYDEQSEINTHKIDLTDAYRIEVKHVQYLSKINTILMSWFCSEIKITSRVAAR